MFTLTSHQNILKFLSTTYNSLSLLDITKHKGSLPTVEMVVIKIHQLLTMYFYWKKQNSSKLIIISIRKIYI